MSSKTALYILKRILLAIFIIFIVITITFFVMHSIPGGPFLGEKAITPEVEAALKAKYGLDKPVFKQYLTYLNDVLHFDFGPSIKQRGHTVNDIISEGFAISSKLGLIAAAIAIIFGVTLGSIAAFNHNRFVDKFIMVTSTTLVAMPGFIIATLLLLIFCVKLQIFPANGLTVDGLVLPVIALSLYPMAYITRLTRSSTLDVLGQDYIRTAKAKGVSQNKIIFKHSLKNSLTPVITYAGPMIAYIVTGSLVIERIFGVAGLGNQFVKSITDRDYPMIMGTTIFLT
ncbi:MAG: ABC transporter permease, partial [Acholeplasmataceae bacterium]|nr:ABC transporter permease [Acholeplasmataceae bacterium]